MCQLIINQIVQESDGVSDLLKRKLRIDTVLNEGLGKPFKMLSFTSNHPLWENHMIVVSPDFTDILSDRVSSLTQNFDL